MRSLRFHLCRFLPALGSAALLSAALWALPAGAEGTPDRNLLSGLGEIERLVSSARYDAGRGGYVSRLPDGREAELTLDHGLQRAMESLLRRYEVPAGAVVALDPRDGRVLALAEHSQEGPRRGLSLRPLYPAASIFKIVTGAALLEAGIEPEAEVCFHGGKRRIDLKNLRDNPKADHTCASLSTAMGKSLNVVFGKLAGRNLSVEALSAVAGRFFFNQPLPLFPSPPDVASALVSPATFPEDELGFGRTAAGFGEVFLSPLHAALLAGTVGNGGVAVEPGLVRLVTGAGESVRPPPPHEAQVVSPEVAASLAEMMRLTVTEGTAHQAFSGLRGTSLAKVSVAGKTGSLADKKPFKDYSWFVGFAPADQPVVAVAAVVVNGPKWRVRAPYVAREALRIHFTGERERRERAETAKAAKTTVVPPG